MIALVRRQPLVSYFVIAFAWTWAFVIVFLILFPLPDIIVRTTPGDFGPLIAAVVMSWVIAGRPGVTDLLKRIVQWRGGVGWFALGPRRHGICPARATGCSGRPTWSPWA